MRIGIMQGRLVPPTGGKIQCFPRERWAEEFALASAAKLEAIEWIYDLHGADVNPIASDHGIALMEALATEHSVAVRSVCADYFMDKPLVRAARARLQERLETLFWLMRRCALLKIGHVVLPFVDASRIGTNDEFDHVVKVLGQALPIAEETGVELHLETSLPPNRLGDLLERLRHPMLKANYDSGNSASLGFHPRDEFAAYGELIGSVHIKDRVHGGGTVPLGSGDADFAALFNCLEEVRYAGDFVLQVARATDGDEVHWATRNREYVLEYLARMR